MKKCPKCNKQMADSSLYCDICGVTLEDVEETKELLEEEKPHNPTKKKKKEEPEILEETEVLEPVEELSILEKHGKSFFESEPEIEKELLEEELKQEEMKKKKLEEVYNLETTSKNKKTQKSETPKITSETKPEENPTIEDAEVIEVVSESVDEKELVPEPVPETIPENVPEPEPATVSEPVPVSETIIESPSLESYHQPEPVSEPLPMAVPIPIAEPQQNVVEQVIEEAKPKRKNNIWISIILGIIGILLLLMFALTNQKKDEKTKDVNTAKFYGDGFSISYSSTWKTSKMDGDITALKYNQEKTYFIPIGQSNLLDTIDCDFEKQACRKNTYKEFYDYWKEDMAPDFIVSEDSSFVHLKEDIYYATYNYSEKETETLIGKFYLIVSKSKNSVLSFQSQVEKPSSIANINPEIVEILKTIDIEDQTSKTKDPDELLEQLSSWGIYSDLRRDAEGQTPNIYGEFRMLSTESGYWIFKEKEFWWYKTEEDLEDNYWYGKIKTKTGKSGMRLVGLKDDKLDAIIKQSRGKVSAGNIYSIILTPKKIISNGEDKSSVNIPSGTEWRFVWIIVDHGKEGIEAQVLNVNTSDTSYFVKIKDY